MASASPPSTTGTSDVPTTTGAAPAPPDEAIVALCPGEEFADDPASVLLARDLPDGGPDVLAAAGLEQLTAGLTDGEQAEGYLVPWPDGADVLRGVSLDGATLTVDFERRVIDSYVAAPGTSTPFFVPLVETAFRQAEVEHLELVINGSVDEWVEWWQGEGSFDRATWRERTPEPGSSCPPVAAD